MTKCKNPECGNQVDALHMDDEGYCFECHNKMLDRLLIEESEETKYLSDESLEIISRSHTDIKRRYRTRNRNKNRRV